MPETKERLAVDVTKEAVANPKNFSAIENSSANFSIFAYKAEFDTYQQVINPNFFSSCYTFLATGDMIRVFIYDIQKKLTNYLEFIVMDVDKLHKTVTTVSIANHNLNNKLTKKE